MLKDEFLAFMECQLEEIKNYQKYKSKVSPDLTRNECIFEWIENYAEDFRQKWEFSKDKK